MNTFSHSIDGDRLIIDNATEQFTEFINDNMFAEDNILNFELLFDLKTIYVNSKDIDTGEEIDISFPNEYLDKTTMQNIVKEKFLNLSDELKELNIFELKDNIAYTSNLLNRTPFKKLKDRFNIAKIFKIQPNKLSILEQEIEKLTVLENEIEKLKKSKKFDLVSEKELIASRERIELFTIFYDILNHEKVMEKDEKILEQHLKELKDLQSLLSFFEKLVNKKEEKEKKKINKFRP